MFELKINEEELKALYLQKLDERMKEIEKDVFFMNSKQLQNYLNMGWSSIVQHLLHEEEFGSIRLGNKWLFEKKRVDAYMQKFSEDVRKQGGNIQTYQRIKK